MRELQARGPHRFEPTRQEVEAKAEEVIMMLKEYWDECGDVIQPGYGHGIFTEAAAFQTDPADCIINSSQPTTFNDIFAASNIAMYDAGTILANAIAWEATSGYPEPNKQRIVVHSASILEAVKFHESQGPNSGGSIVMVFPMKVVRRATPSNAQRDQAQAALDRWGETRGVDGICKFADTESDGIYSDIRKMEARRSFQ